MAPFPAVIPASVGLALPHPELVAPVERLAARPVGPLELEPAADVADVGIGEAADELPERIGSPGRVRVRERHHLARQVGDDCVLRGRLALARPARDADPRIARGQGFDRRVGAVRGSVRGDDDLESVGRVVELEQVLDAPTDHVLLVVRRHHDGDGGRHVVLANRAGTPAGQCVGGERVAHVRPGERARA